MRALMLEVPEELLEDRRRKDLDRLDEVWDGVIHMVPPPTTRHSFFVEHLKGFFRGVAERRGLALPVSEIGVFDPEQGLSNFRVPDIVVAALPMFSERGIEGVAPLVIEVLSPNDESYDKLPFYARVGVLEVWIADPKTKTVEVFESRAGLPVKVPSSAGRILSPTLGVELTALPGPKLQLRDGDVVVEI
jgi:Uma2 family endonuclease